MNSFYMEESELLAFAIFANMSYRKDDIEDFNKGDHGYRIYQHEKKMNIYIDRTNEYLMRIARLYEDGLKEENLFYIYQNADTSYNYYIWKVTDMYTHPEYKGEELLKIVPQTLFNERAKITAVLELQDWVYN